MGTVSITTAEMALHWKMWKIILFYLGITTFGSLKAEDAIQNTVSETGQSKRPDSLGKVGWRPPPTIPPIYSWAFYNPDGTYVPKDLVLRAWTRAARVWSENANVAVIQVDWKYATYKFAFAKLDGRNSYRHKTVHSETRPYVGQPQNVYESWYSGKEYIAYYKNGIFYIDNQELFSVESYSAPSVNLEILAALLIGECIGLKQTFSKNSLMYMRPWFSTWQREGLYISEGDLAQLHGKWGKKPSNADKLTLYQTPENDNCGGHVSCLDRHTIYCYNAKEGKLLKQFQLDYDEASGKMRYNYTCATRRTSGGCPSGPLCTRYPVNYTPWKETGDNSVSHLDGLVGQVIDCKSSDKWHGTQGFLMDLRMEWKNKEGRTRHSVRYRYTCCQSVDQDRTCSKHSTRASDKISSTPTTRSVPSLSDLNVSCPTGKMLSKVQLVQYRERQWSYEFTCCY